MKRYSCAASSSSCSSSSPSPSSSSSSSSLEFQNPDQTEARGRASNKRARRSGNGNGNVNGDGNNADNKSKKMKAISSNSSSAINAGRRSSVYRGVTRHRWTGRFEAHLWDKSCWNNLQNKKGRQVYLGAYDNEEAAARTYDLAALKYWGRDSTLNFPIEIYSKELDEMEKATKEEYLASLRRQSSGFSRGVSKYRGVARHHHNGRWEARIGRVLGNKYLYLGTYGTQEEAATAYDLAAIQYRGANAVTNFDISRYIDKINNINQNNNGESQQDQTLITIPSPQVVVEEDEEEEEAPPNSSSDESENMQNQKQPPKQKLQDLGAEPQNLDPQVQTSLISPPNEESSLIAHMDPTTMTTDEQELPWIFMDDDRFSQFQVPDLPDGDLPSVFGDNSSQSFGHYDDIGFLFKPDYEEANFNLDMILSSPSYGDQPMMDSMRIATSNDDDDDNDDECGQVKLICSANSATCSPNSSISYSDYTL